MDDSLLSEKSAQASSALLKSVAQAVHKEPVSKTPSPSFRGGETVEDLAIEAMKPMLKEWLDANLPALVERIVEKEIRKIAQ